MSASNEWWEYHLTLDGWVEGSEKVDFAGLKEREAPAKIILTLEFHERMSSMYSPIDRWVNKRKGNYDVTNEQLNKLYEKYGRVPEGYEDYLEYLR